MKLFQKTPFFFEIKINAYTKGFKCLNNRIIRQFGAKILFTKREYESMIRKERNGGC